MVPKPCLGGLGSDLGIKKNLSKAVLADFGQARIVENLAQMVQDAAKLELFTMNTLRARSSVI